MSLSSELQTVLHDELVGVSVPVSPLLAQYNAVFGNVGLDRVGKAQALADIVNSDETNRTKVRASMSGSEVFKATVSADYATLPDGKKSEWLSFCGIDSLDPEVDGVAEEFVKYIFGAASNTVSALATNRVEIISRGAELELPEINANDVLESCPTELPA